MSAAAGALRDLWAVKQLGGQGSATLETRGGSAPPLGHGVAMRASAAAALAKVAASEQRDVAWKVLQRDAAAGWRSAEAEGDAFGIAESGGVLAAPRVLPIDQSKPASGWDILQAGGKALITGGLGGTHSAISLWYIYTCQISRQNFLWAY